MVGSKLSRWEKRKKKVRFARQLRQQMTEAECILWEVLRNRRLGGAKFRRQAPVLQFIADFLCKEHHLVIEVDGDIHKARKEYDFDRDSILAEHGYSTIRFTNHEVINNLDDVLERIYKELE